MADAHMILQADIHPDDTERRLNALACDGWEVIAVVGPNPSSTDRIYLRQARTPAWSPAVVQS
jgi:hypothetical protein